MRTRSLRSLRLTASASRLLFCVPAGCCLAMAILFWVAAPPQHAVRPADWYGRGRIETDYWWQILTPPRGIRTPP